VFRACAIDARFGVGACSWPSSWQHACSGAPLTHGAGSQGAPYLVVFLPVQTGRDQYCSRNHAEFRWPMTFCVSPDNGCIDYYHLKTIY
jgi:hypothetical protein